jgi:preprotein translocase SecF subunit
MKFFDNTNIKFIQNRKWAYLLSTIIIIAGLVSLVVKGGPRFSIDFTGGVSLELNLAPANQGTPAIHIDQIRKVLKETGVIDAEIQKIGDPNGSIFLIKAKKRDPKEVQIVDILKKAFPEYTNKSEEQLIRLQEEVGPKVGSELKVQAIKAVLISFLLMIIYIWFRFELTFGVAAVLALIHDVLITVGIFSIMDKEISVTIIAALLTIVGFSINDTIVIYDRIREDMKIYRKETTDIVFNNAINRTLSRTIITSGTVLLCIISLLLFGGSVIRDFGWAMLIGVVSGTYSSVLVASPLVVDYYRIRGLRDKDIKTFRKKK